MKRNSLLAFFAIALLGLALSYNACSVKPPEGGGATTGNPMIPGIIMPITDPDGSMDFTLRACLTGAEFTSDTGEITRFEFESPVNIVISLAGSLLPALEIKPGYYRRVSFYSGASCATPNYELTNNIGTFSITQNFVPLLSFEGTNVQAADGLTWSMNVRPLGSPLSLATSDAAFLSELQNRSGIFHAVTSN